jgi:hypothetical protein
MLLALPMNSALTAVLRRAFTTRGTACKETNTPELIGIWLGHTQVSGSLFGLPISYESGCDTTESHRAHGKPNEIHRAVPLWQ